MGVPLFGREHVDRYREPDGEEGHDWQDPANLTAGLPVIVRSGRDFGPAPNASSGAAGAA
jgi:hypothetical protein